MRLYITFIFLILFILIAFAKGKIDNSKNSKEYNYNKNISMLQVGNSLQQISNDGSFPADDGIWNLNKNIIFPKIKDFYSNYYSRSGVVFKEGILWGGMVNDGQIPTLRVNGATYRTGLMPGAILGLGTGIVENPDDANVKIWRVRIDWETADLSEESYFLSMNQEEVRNIYQFDWNNWPGDKGTPFQDVDGDGQYDPVVDIPGVPGASQTAWYVANDINGQRIYDSPPIGIEMQMTLWSYDKPKRDPFADMIFKRVRLIYKGTGLSPLFTTIDSMFITQWVDPDIGYFADDLVGCDTTLQLAYAYNSNSTDSDFDPFGMAPPAIGYLLLSGPAIPSNGDTAIINFNKRLNKKNLPLFCFYWLSAGYEDASDPSLGIYDGTLEWYNLMRGFMPQPGYPSSKPWIDPTDNRETKFPLSGDPIQKVGWYDGVYVNPGDRRMGLSIGPFQMSLGDTQEVVFAFLGERWTSPPTYLQAITGVKSKARTIKDFVRKGFSVGIIADKKLIPVDTTVNLRSSLIFIGDKKKIKKYEWQIVKSPFGSSGQLNNIADSLVTFRTNKVGSYTIQIKAFTDDDQSSIGEIIIHVFKKNSPVATFSLNNYEIFWGDSILADASASYDPDGDSLYFKWELIDRWEGAIAGDDSIQSIIYPYASGKFSIRLIVSDGFLQDTLIKQFYVKPILENISIKHTLSDTSWFRAMPFFYQDFILIPMNQKDFMRIYRITDSGINKYKDVDLPKAILIRVIKDNYIVVGLEDISTGFYGPGPISIYQFDSNWNLTPILENYTPNREAIYRLQFVGDSAFVITNYDRNFYWINFFSNPISPIILKQKYFTWDYILKAINNRYIFFEKYGNKDSLYIYDKFTFDHIKTVDWKKRFYSLDLNGNVSKTYSINSNYLFAGVRDSLQIYKITPNLELDYQSIIRIIPPFRNFVTEKFSGSGPVFANLISDNILLVSYYGFNVLFNFTNPREPEKIALYGDGYYY